MDRIGRDHLFVKGAADRARKHFWRAADIAIRVPGEHLKQRIEIIRTLINVKDQHGPLRADTLAQVFDRDPHRCE